MKLTVAFITARREPMLALLTDSLAAQLQPGDAVSLLAIDAFGRELGELAPTRLERFASARALQAKPNIWQGPHRIAPRNLWATANARNTALVYCQDDYIAFLDDRTTLGPTWLETVRRGERERQAVLCGPIDKYLDGQNAVAWGPVSHDHRSGHAPGGKINCGGSWCFGANFCLPLEWALVVNGCEEGCDPVGCEDYIFGAMLENHGFRLDFVPALGVQQDRKGDAHVTEFPRIGKGPSGPTDKSQALTRRYRKLRHTSDATPNLRELRARVQRGEPLPVPDPSVDYRDWYDNERVASLSYGQPPPIG